MNQWLTPGELQRLIDEHGRALQLYAAQWCETPEDCVQEAFLRLFAEPCRPRQPVAWLYRVARNQGIALQRSTARRRNRERQAVRLARRLEAQQPSQLSSVTVSEALAALDDLQRETVIARIWGGLGFAEIAEIHNVSVSTAHRRYEAALSQLRREWQDHAEPQRKEVSRQSGG